MNFFKATSLFILQIFCVAQLLFAQPTISSFTPSSGAIGTIVTITGANLNNSTSINIGGVAALRISNTGTSLVAMVMPGATTGAVSITTGGGTANGVANFTITTAGNPTTRSGSKLMPIITNDSSNEMGEFVAMSADGKTVAIGGRFSRVGGVFARGPIVVFANNNGVWAQQGSPLYGADDLTGCGSLSLSADGNTLLVGGYTSAPGGAYIFTRTNGVWSQQGSKLVGAGAIGNSQQGFSVSLSADGNTAAICGFKDNSAEGGVYIFTRTNGVWTQQGNKLVGTGSTGNVSQGEAIHLSADGNTLLVAGLEDDDFKGAVWVFSRSGGVWSQQGNKLVGTGTARADAFGWALSSSADGNTAMVGSDSKGAWVFTRSMLGIWSLQTKLATPAAASGFGSALSLSADGNTAVVGDPYDNAVQGAVYIFNRSGNSWSQQGGKLSGSGYSQSTWSRFLSLSADGSIFISGSKANNADASAAWIFSTPIPTPTISSFSPANGSIGSLVTITGTNLNSPTGISIGGVPAIVISNTGTSLVAMVMPGATTGTISVTTAGGTANGTGNFTINAKTFPNAQQGAKLVGTGAVGTGSEQGKSVSISADGNTAVVSGYTDDGLKGAVWVYTRTGGNWTQEGTKLTATGAVGNAGFGSSVSLSADGNTILIGGTFDNNNLGAVWVFTRTGGVWSQQGNKLVGTGSTGTTVFQGGSVSISADGNTAISGGYGDNNNQGAVWVFKRTGNSWAQQSNKLIGTGVGSFPRVGYSVSLSADGNTIITGGYSDNNQGAAWVFTQSAGVWSQQGNKLTATGNTGNSSLGISVAINADGNTAVIGGYGDDGNKGAVWIFTRTASVWSQQGNKLAGNDKVGNAIEGLSVTISADGNTVVTGGPVDNTNTGASWVYGRTAGVWTQRGNKFVGTGNVGSNPQGASLAISADGNTAIVGGKADNTPGAAWVFVNSAEPKTSTTTFTACSSYAWNGITYTVSGTYTKTFPGGSSIGTDSIATLNLTINQPSTSTTTTSARNEFTWNTVLYKKSGTYTRTFAGGNAKGCDSVATLNITIVDTSATTVTNCGNYIWNGTTYTNSGTYTRTFVAGSAQGNDSIATLNLTINQPSTSTTPASARNGFTWNGVLYKKSGTYTKTFTAGNAKGCDSVATLNLIIVDTSATSITNCGNYIWNGTTYTNSGTYTRTFTGGSAQGNDSIATLNLTINQPSISTTNASARNGFTWNTVLYKKSGIYTRTFTAGNAKGCDSVATLNITIVDTSATTITNCGNFIWNGTTYTTSGTYTKTFTGGSAQGNDSIATLNLTINQLSTSTTNASARNGFTWNTVLYKKSGTYTRTFTAGNAKGCDSVATLNLIIVDTSATTVINCGNYIWNGTTYTNSGTYTKTFVGGSAQGNDSIATLNLTINRTTISSVTLSACDSLIWNGTVYKTSGIYTRTLIASNSRGCDSVITLNLTVNNSTSSTTTINISNGGSYVFNSVTYRTAGTYQAKLQNSKGCDSIANLVLTTNSVTFTSTIVNNPCINSTAGSISIAATGGFGALNYSLNNGVFQTSAVFSNLTSGAYTVNVRDAQGFIVSKIETVVSLSNTTIVPVLTAQNVSCFNGNNGSISISSITGGIAPYTTLWTPGNSTTNTINNLTIGNYTARVTDALGCFVTAQQTITQPTQLVVAAIITNPSCNNQCNGTIQAITSGGTGVSSFTWSNSATTSLISNLCAGNYTVTATDANGCIATRVNTVANPTLFTIKVDSIYTICANQNYKTDITNTSFPSSTYSWTSTVGVTASTPAVTFTTPGFYYARAVSPNGCIALDTLDLRASKDSIKSEFQVATNVFVGDTVKFVNINQPFPDSSIWNLPAGTSYNTVSQRPVLLELKFNAAGQYAVGLRTVRGACQSTSTKTISVLQPTGIPNPGSPVLSYYIESFGISPNPNRGVFTVNIKLSQPSAIRLRLVNTVTGAVISNLPFASSKNFTIPYNLTLGNGTYVMILETSFAPGFFQMIVQ